MTLESNVDGRDSVFEPIATQLIAEWYGWNESSLAALEESQEATLEDMRLGYPQRTIHLANEYDMGKRTWNLENHLKVKLSKIRNIRNIKTKCLIIFSNMGNGVNQMVTARDIIL